MRINLVEARYDILDLANKYADHLAVHCTDLRKPHQLRTGLLQWKNPENLESGASGNVLFFIELYKQTGEEKYLEIINNLVRDLITYCEETPANNYSLYTGRGGVIYVLMQLHQLTGEEYLLKECLNLVKPCNHEYLHSRYTSDYLYDGRAGTLLLLMNLYLLTHQEFLAEYMNQFANKIIANAKLSANGIHWSTGDEMNLKASCGFAYGTAGIRYVLKKLHHYCSDPVLDLVLHEIDRFTASSWLTDYQNWGCFRKDILNYETLRRYKTSFMQGDELLFVPKDDVSWAYGTTGVLLSSLDKIGTRKYEAASDKLSAVILDGSLRGINLHSGLAGIGMYYLHTSNGLSDKELHVIQYELMDRISPEINTDGGLLHGELGIVYFLLKTTNIVDRTENVLLPFANTHKHKQQPGINPVVKLQDARKRLLTANFQRTLYILEKIAPEVLNEYINRHADAEPASEIARFIDFISNRTPNKITPAFHERLMDVFGLEKTKFEFSQVEKRSRLQTYLEELTFNDAILQKLNMPDEWLASQHLRITGKIKMVETRWDWSFLDDFEPMRNKQVLEKFIKNLTVAPKEFQYIFQVSGRQEVVEIFCNLAFQMTLQRFAEPNSITQAIAQIKYYISSLNEKALESLMYALGAASSTQKEFIQQIDNMVMDSVKPLIHRNILVIK
jgi:hypothetical protein